jgi:hypothetical protein
VSTQILSLVSGAQDMGVGTGYDPTQDLWNSPPGTTGSLVPATLTDNLGVVWNITVLAGTGTGGIFSVYVAHNGGNIPPQNMFTSVAFTDGDAIPQLFTTAAIFSYTPTGVDGFTHYRWLSTTKFTATNTYPITFVIPAPPPAVPPSATGGQTLSPNRNVVAPAGFGGDVWGANGGGVTPYNTDPQVLVALSDCGLPANYLLNGGGSPNPNSAEVASSMSDAALLGTTLTSALPFNGSNAG